MSAQGGPPSRALRRRRGPQGGIGGAGGDQGREGIGLAQAQRGRHLRRLGSLQPLEDAGASRQGGRDALQALGIQGPGRREHAVGERAGDRAGGRVGGGQRPIGSLSHPRAGGKAASCRRGTRTRGGRTAGRPPGRCRAGLPAWKRWSPGGCRAACHRGRSLIGRGVPAAGCIGTPAGGRTAFQRCAAGLLPVGWNRRRVAEEGHLPLQVAALLRCQGGGGRLTATGQRPATQDGGDHQSGTTQAQQHQCHHEPLAPPPVNRRGGPTAGGRLGTRG